MQPMGNIFCPKDRNQMYKQQLGIVTDLQKYFTKYRTKLDSAYLNTFSLINSNDLHRKQFEKVFQTLEKHDFSPQKFSLSLKESRGIAVMLGMAICDALGASTEFHSFKKQGYGLIKNGFEDIYEAIKNKKLSKRHGHIGIWTDDASMGLAMAYALMLNEYKFNPVDTRYMFHLWLEHGLGNGGRGHSIGLGGNISISMREFSQNPTLPKTEEKNQDNNGNGSLMRLAPIPVAFCDSLSEAKSAAQNQSLTTHNGLQAKECSRLMTEIIIALIHRKPEEDPKKILIEICDTFESEVESVVFLAKGKKQTQEGFQKAIQNFSSFEKWNKGLKDRNWNWREPEFTYSPTRTAQYSGYAGSYCMDGLAMALHMAYFTQSFKECAVKCADMGGDCDTVGSIAGQITGAMYGIDSEMLRLYMEMEDCAQGRYEVFLVAYKLINKVPIGIQMKKGKQEILQQIMIQEKSEHEEKAQEMSDAKREENRENII